MREPETKPSIQVITRMMTLLDALARYSEPVNLKQLATETKLHPSTAHRILNVMVRNRMADRVKPGIYGLGMRLLDLGTLVRSRLSVRQEALPYMQQLCQQLGETVNLSVRHDDEIIYVERASSGIPMPRMMQIISSRAPLHITAVGKVFLAADSPEKCVEYAKRTGLPRFTANTLTDHASLLQEMEHIRRQGYAFDDQEAEEGVSCVAAGIYSDGGRLVAGLSVSAPSERFNRTWAVQVKQMTERISRGLTNQLPHAATATSE